MVKAATDTLAPEDQALQESFWGRGAERQRSRSDHPTARIGAPTPAPRRRAPSTTRRRSGKGRVFLTWLLVVVVLAGVVAGGWWWRNRDGAPRTAARTTEGVVAAPVPVATVSAPVTVLSYRAADGRLDLAMAVGTNQAGTKSSVLLMPVGTQLEVPANGIQQLAELHRLGGDPLVDLGVENALGVAVERSAILDDAALKAMFDATGQLLVTLPRAVAIAEPALNLPAGSQTLTSEQAVALLTRTPTGVSELDHLDTVRAVLTAWLDALQSGDRATAVAQAVTTAPLATAARTGATVDVLPVDSIGLGADERYVISSSDAQRTVSDAFPDAVFTTAARPRIEIRGSGDPEILTASSCIVRAGGNIRLTGRSEAADNTSVVFYRDREFETAQRMQAALGAGSVKQADRDLDLVDVTIVVGKDFIGCQ